MPTAGSTKGTPLSGSSDRKDAHQHRCPRKQLLHISLNIDQRTGKLIVVSVIDNLVKGQAGSAVQNMNIMFGWMRPRGS